MGMANFQILSWCSSQDVYTFWGKGRKFPEINVCSYFLPVPGLNFPRHQQVFSFFVKVSFRLYLLHSRVVHCSDFLCSGQRNGINLKDVVSMSNFRALWLLFVSIWLSGTKYWLTAGVVFLNVSFTLPIMVSSVLWYPWSQLLSQCIV